MKKTLLLSSILLLSTGIFADKVEVDGIYYELNTTNHTATVTKGGSGDIVIPESITYKNRPFNVTSIGWYAFQSPGLTSVTIPNSVTSISPQAFSGCTGLTSVIIGNSVTSIGNSAFSDCSGLTSITIPNSVTSIGMYAFYNCTGLTSIVIGNSVTSIGDYAFSGCTELTSVIIGNSVTSIGNSAFSGCSGLTSITIPNSVTSIRNYAFEGCTGLTSIVIGNSVTSIGDYAFSGCTGLTSVTIPNSVKIIEKYAFADNSELTSLTIGNSVARIGGSAFSGCNNIETVVSLNPTPPYLVGSNPTLFSSDVYFGTLYVPVGSGSAYRNANGWKNFYEIIEGIPDDINDTFPLSVSASKGGSVSFLDKKVSDGSASFAVESGTKVTLSIAPDEGYRFVSLIVNGNDVTEDIVDDTYTIKEINEATSAVATFEDKSVRRAKMDNNGDGEVNSADVVNIYNYIITGE